MPGKSKSRGDLKRLKKSMTGKDKRERDSADKKKKKRKKKHNGTSALSSHVEAATEPADDMPPFTIVCSNTPPRTSTSDTSELATATNSLKRKRAASSFSEPQFQKHGIVESLGVYWKIKPGEEWRNLKRYQKFIVGDLALEIGAIVYVNHDQEDSSGKGQMFDPSKQWIAQVLEVRAKDQHHVYLRVFWLYRHADLPPNLQAITPYHGENELIISNDMDIIDAMSVNGRVSELKRFRDDQDETDPEEEWYQDLIWRQTYDKTTKKLSKLRHYCVCNLPTDPDKLLVRCSNSDCGKWCHAKCIEDDTVARQVAQSNHETTNPDPAEKPGGENGPKGGSGMFSALKSAIRGTPKPVSKDEEAVSAEPDETPAPEAPVFEATVFKKHKDEQKQSRCMVRITRRSADGLDEREWEEDIKCLFCKNTID